MIQSFSVCTSVYKNDRPEFVKVALDSMLLFQSLKPSEIVLVQDGPVPESLSSLLLEYEEKYNDVVRIIRLETNMGLGNALKVGVENAKYDIIARMDSDDICLPNRFQKQLEYLENHPEVDIIGGQMTEFIDNPENIVGIREVPLSNDDIYEYIANLVAATRNNQYISLGVSPRGSVALSRMAKARAFICEREYVIPDDVLYVFKDVVGHRIILSQKSKINNINLEEVIKSIEKQVKMPRLK